MDTEPKQRAIHRPSKRVLVIERTKEGKAQVHPPYPNPGDISWPRWYPLEELDVLTSMRPGG